VLDVSFAFTVEHDLSVQSSYCRFDARTRCL
jgi:hypothetical protein